MHSFVVAQKLHQVVALFLFLQIIRLSAGIRPATALINSLHVGLGSCTSSHWTPVVYFRFHILAHVIFRFLCI